MELHVEKKIFGRMEMMKRVHHLLRTGHNLPEIEDDPEICDLCRMYFLDKELEHFYFVVKNGLNKGR